MIHAQQPHNTPIVIEEKRVTVDELAGMVARGFKESGRNMKEFMQITIGDAISESEKNMKEFIGTSIGGAISRSEKNMKEFVLTTMHEEVSKLETKMDSGFNSIHKRFDSLVVKHV